MYEIERYMDAKGEWVRIYNVINNLDDALKTFGDLCKYNPLAQFRLSTYHSPAQQAHTNKIKKLRELERQGYIREECPEKNYWRFKLQTGISLSQIPTEFHDEYNQHGEIRW